ncbi:hypothetical protein M422DRAFT_211924 [Sphaerobolus stellatus SS14]|uniref:Protein YTP1-like C-terminal domain-containing protein n=1 Tax=Sphaerobolus stellatus (strain SS14) TaxID=990650 RepID=A0A0C9VIA4_SPHS4|nr:hypothetical protein M422DRAFT_211924 [Sphaerobolus stellatus SS14]
MADGRSPLSVVYLLHIALEAPIALQGLWAGQSLPFQDMNNTSLLILKLYSALLTSSCVVAFLAFSLPEFLPGKRATAIGFMMYHCIAASILWSAPRFIPHSFGTLAESIKITPEILWSGLHGILSFAFGIWWQGTLGFARAIKQQ